MNRGLALFSTIMIYCIAFGALTICIILLPELAREGSVENPSTSHLSYIFLAGAYVTAVPFFVALYYANKLLQQLHHKKAFSRTSVALLSRIKICAMIFSGLVIATAIIDIALLRNLNPQEDVTHIIALGVIFTFIPCVFAVFAAVLQKLLSEAIAIKKDNDLIV